MKDLSTKIDTELAFHDEKAKEASTASDLKSIDVIHSANEHGRRCRLRDRQDSGKEVIVPVPAA